MKLTVTARWFLAIVAAYVVMMPFLLVAQVTNGATNGVPFDPSTAPLPADVAGYWKYAIALVTPIIIWLVRLGVPKLPKMTWPIVAPFLGIALGALLQTITNAHISWVDEAALGGLGTWVRELVNKTITEREGAETSKS